MSDDPAKMPDPPITTDVDLSAYPLHDRVREMLSDGFAAEEATVFLQAFLAQSCDRVPRDETTTAVTVADPYLVRFIVRRLDAGPIRVVLGGSHEVVDADARTVCTHGILLVPGATCHVEPQDAILLGMRLSPRQCLEWWHDATETQRELVTSNVVTSED
jgi:hypothetical protein